MKTKFNGILTLFLAFVVQISFAQERTISGTVSDESGPLPQVSVLKKGTTQGVETDFDGNYTIQAKTGDVLVFSFVGMSAVEKTVGTSNRIDVSMASGNMLDEVVVTAQGIKREKKALGYAVTTVKAEEIADRAQTDVGRLLQGKAPGVRITSTGGVAGSGTNIIIRGYSSISGNNQPLFIVDGVPFDSSTNQSSSFVTGSNTASRFGDLDQNNIESISVLKGLSATALYGEEGKNGVILITTKSGKNRRKKNEVTISQGVFFNEIVLPDYQNTYGNGFYNGYGPFFSNWGSRFDSAETIPNAFLSSIENNFGVSPSTLWPNLPELDAETVEYRPYDSQKEYFRTGTIFNTSVNLSGGNETSSYSLNYGRLEDKGFIPENKVIRNNIALGGSIKLSNNFSVNGKLNYAKYEKKSPMTDASFGSDVFGSGVASVFNVLYIPRSVDLMGYPYQHPITGESVWYRANNGRTNPLWATYNTFDDNDTNRFFGNASVTYNFNDDISLAYRFGLDYYTESQTRAVNRGSQDGRYPLGYLSTTVNQNTINDHTLLLNLDKKLNDDFRLSFIGGLNLRRSMFDQINTNSTRQLRNQFGLLRHNAFEITNGSNFASIVNNNAVYANAILDYKNWIFLNLSARNDWSSVFEKGQNSIFSYGASASFDITKAIPSLKENTAFDYLKFRVGYGKAPGFAGPYSTRPILSVNPEAFSLGGTNVPANYISNSLPNPNLRPELSEEIELGLEANFFNRRLGFEVTYYNKNTEDQIISRPLPAETGYTSYSDNFGNVTNKGIELGFNAIPLKTDNFTWNLSGSYNINENLVEDTQGQVVQIAGFGGGLGNYAIEGEAFGIIQGSVVERDANGNKMVDANGDYIISATDDIIGDPNPDWTMSLVNGLTFKGFNLTAQIEYQHGGDMYIRTANTLAARGLTTDTDFDRNQTFILPGVSAATGLPNTKQISATDAYFDNYGFGADEFNVYDVTNIRIREVALSYAFSDELIKNTPFGSVSITAQVYNPWVKAFNTPKGTNFDPDINSTGVGNGQGFDLLTSWNSRRYGLSVKLSF